MAKVYKRKDENIEALIKRFRKAVNDEGIMKELKKREYYLSPSQKRKEKSKQARKRLAKQMRKQAKYSNNNSLYD